MLSMSKFKNLNFARPYKTANALPSGVSFFSFFRKSALVSDFSRPVSQLFLDFFVGGSNECNTLFPD